MGRTLVAAMQFPGAVSALFRLAAAQPDPAGSTFMDLRTFRTISRSTPAGRRPQAWWDLLSVLGGVAGAVIWFLYASVRSAGEGFDFISPALMIGIPVLLAMKRESIDALLLPLQRYRRRFPRSLLVGAGLAVPFLTAFLLYNLLGITQYSLMYTNLVVGTFCSYAIIRDPPGAAGTPPQNFRGARIAASLILFMAACVGIATAHDCLTDPFNARDCLRTGGFAEGMAGGATSLLSCLVNGPIILQSLGGGGRGPGDEGSSGGLSPEFAGSDAGGGGPDDNADTVFDGGGGPGQC